MKNMTVGQLRTETTPFNKFRHGIILKKSSDFNFESLNDHCEDIIFATEGYIDDTDYVRIQLEVALKDFDAEKDLIVPAGSAFINLMAGGIIQRKIMESGRKNWDSYAMAKYKEGRYLFWRVSARTDVEAYEIAR